MNLEGKWEMHFMTNEITPQDQYQVRITDSIEISEITHLIHLYQPIIGAEATSLYLTLRNHLPFLNKGVSPMHAHRQLANQLYIPFHNLMKARKILEAIGLLRTKKFNHKTQDQAYIEYILVPPLQPVSFFQDDILSILLLNRVGKTTFDFIMKQVLPKETGSVSRNYTETEITKAFDEVFDSVLLSELTQSDVEQLIQPVTLDNESEKQKKIEIKRQHIDVDFIKGMVSNLFQVERIFTKENIQLFNEVAFLYQLSDMDLIHLLHDQFIYDESGNIQERLFRKRIKEKIEYEQKETRIIEKKNIEPIPESQPETNGMDKEKRHRWNLEHYSPVQLLKQYQGGAKIPEADLSLVEGLVRDFQLPFPVANVLIEYVLLSNEYKLPKNLTEKIAGHWKRMRISNVDEALQLAKKEHQLYKGWTEGSRKGTSAQNRSTKPKKTEKREKVPDYILNQNQKYHQSQSNDNPSQTIDPQIQEKVETLLRKLGETEEGAKK